jgi:hypothetical protein
VAAALGLLIASAQAAHAATQPRVLVVIAGSTTTLSRTTVSPGAVLFEITNRGRTTVTFQIAGKRTRPIRPGATVPLSVTLRGVGAYRYVASRPGVLHVVAAAQPAAVATPAPAPSVASGRGAQQCASPATTTVSVTMTDATGDSYTFSPAAIACGGATFVLTNNGKAPHALELMDPLGDVFASSAVVAPSATLSMTANLRYKGVYQWSDGDGLAGEAFETTTGWFTVQ